MMGYGENISESSIRLGTASRIFYMAGKIPLRLDIEPIKRIQVISFADICSMSKRSYA